MVALKQQRPIFGFLWPAARAVPQDDDAVQLTWVRVPPRGPWRLVLLLAATALLITVGAAMISALFAAPSLVGLIVSAAVLVASVMLLGRAWAVGTSVSDAGIKISRLRTTTVVPWTRVRGIDAVDGSRLLGLPAHMSGSHVVVATADDTISTHVASASPDLWLRPQAYDAAVSTLRTWWRETR